MMDDTFRPGRPAVKYIMVTEAHVGAGLTGGSSGMLFNGLRSELTPEKRTELVEAFRRYLERVADDGPHPHGSFTAHAYVGDAP